ncbi:MAG: PKD domain-containing protein [Bacteroidia bacterium]
MKKFAIALVSMLLSLPLVTVGQQVLEVQSASVERDVPVRAGLLPPNSPSGNALSACSPDTLAYTVNKASGLRVLNVNGSSSAAALSQYYDAPQPLSVSKVRFYAYKLNTNMGTTANVVVELYNARPDSLPLGAPLRTATVQVDTNFHGGAFELEKVATFSQPVMVTGPYLVVIRNNSANPVGVVVSDYQAGDGKGEWLASAHVNGTWRHGYQITVSGMPLDCDALIDPVVSYHLRSNFAANPSCIAGPTTATFNNLSSPILRHRMYNVAAFLGIGGRSVNWNFGDGTGDHRQVVNYDTTHYYAAAGAYNVYLLDSLFGWTMVCYSDTTIQMGQAPSAGFNYTTNELTLQFNNLSSNAATSWHWNFGDGSSSTLHHPTHTFPAAGTYTVCLTATSWCGSDSVCQTVTVTCPAPLTAFSTSLNNLNASFIDQSTGNPTSWQWTFGDGDSSTLQHPTHAYSAPGNYLVCLKTTNACGFDSSWYWLNVVCPRPTADFSSVVNGFDVDFTDLSTGNPTSWVWDFGDGINSSLQNPTHTYAQPGNYLVCLYSNSDCGQDTLCGLVEINALGSQDGWMAGFSLSPNPVNGGNVRMEIRLPEAADVAVEVVNALGQRMIAREIGWVDHAVRTLDVSGLPSGTYAVTLLVGERRLVQRLQVLR